MEGLLGVENMTAAAKDTVIKILQQLPTYNLEKRFLYARWARLVGIDATKQDINSVAPWTQP